MAVAKIAISIDASLLEKIDHFVAEKKFKTRSKAIQIAVSNTVDRLEHTRLTQECAKLNSVLEQQLADEGLAKDVDEWPEF